MLKITLLLASLAAGAFAVSFANNSLKAAPNVTPGAKLSGTQGSPIIDPALLTLYPICGTAVAGCDALGNFNPATNVVMDLSQAVTLGGSPNGNATYDPARWAVIYHFKSVTIPAGKIVTFKNHASRAPVIWLVEESVQIDGEVNLDGTNAAYNVNGPIQNNFTESGPGGFRGGKGAYSSGPGGSCGFGIGGGRTNGNVGLISNGSGGSYGTLGASVVVGSASVGTAGPTYGSPQIFPLVGGSGGAAAHTPNTSGFSNQGGAGGGAILIVSNASITVSSTGYLHAVGGFGINSPYDVGSNYRYSGSGSGGAIRIVANAVTFHSGTPGARVIATGGSNVGGGSPETGGVGRIRVEVNGSNNLDLQVDSSPNASRGFTPGPVFNPTPPDIQLVSVNGISANLDPNSGLATGTTDLVIPAGQNTVLVFEATNIAAGKQVTIRITDTLGGYQDIPAQPLVATANPNISTVSFTVNLVNGVSAIQARVQL